MPLALVYYKSPCGIKQGQRRESDAAKYTYFHRVAAMPNVEVMDQGEAEKKP